MRNDTNSVGGRGYWDRQPVLGRGERCTRGMALTSPQMTHNVPSFLIDTVIDEVSYSCSEKCLCFTELWTRFTELWTRRTMHPG